MTVDRRVKLLNVDRDQAERDHRSCLERVDRVARAPDPP